MLDNVYDIWLSNHNIGIVGMVYKISFSGIIIICNFDIKFNI